MRKKILLLIMAIALTFSGVMANSPPPPSQIVALGSAFNQLPGTVSLPLNMYGFTNVGSIDLKINFDRNLVQYVDYSGATVTGLTVNESLPGVLSVSFVNFGSVGVNITGLLANLNFIYLGSFTADLVFNQSECEVSDFTTIMPVPINSFTNGQVTALTPFDGIVSLVPQQGLINSSVSVPLTIQGTNFTNLSAITFKIAYNPAQLTFQNATNNPMGFSVGDDNGVITIGASGNGISGANLNDLTTILNLNFVYLGGGTAQLNFQPGSQVVDFNFNVMSTLFLNATVQQDPISDLGTLTIASPSAVTSSSFNVPISVSGLSSSLTTVGAATIKVAYDTANLTYTGYAANQLAAGGWVFAQSAGHLTFVKTNATAMTIANGDLLTLAFKGKCAKTGTAALSFDPGTFLQDISFGNLPMNLVNGSVTLTPAVLLSPTGTICMTSGLTLTAPEGVNYLWSLGGANTQSIIVPSAGSYTVTVTNADLCDLVITSTVNPLPSKPTITPGGSTTFCAGGTVNLASSAGSGYLWSNAATTPKIDVTTSGSFTVQVTDGNGCQSVPSEAVVVTVNPLPSKPTITPDGLTTFCAGGTVNLASSTGSGYLWSNAETTPSIDVTTSGSFTVQVTDGNGCQSVASDAAVVTVNPLPSKPTITPGGSTTFCAGGTVNLASSAGSGYLWSNAATTPSIDVTASGSFTVQVTDANGCQSVPSDAAVVTVNPLPSKPTITPGGPTTFCAGGTVNLASSAGLGYLWSNAATTPSIDVTASGSFTVQVTDANGCQSVPSEAVVVTVNPLPIKPTITPDGPITFCAGGTVNLASSTGSGYLWSNAATTPSINVTASGSFTVQVTDGNGCQSVSSDAVVITVNPIILNTKVFLQGPYTANAMATTLRTKAYFPKNQPYNVAPWNYAGTESVVSVPANVVDWVLVELRSGTAAGSPATGTTLVSKKAGFVLSNGNVVGVDGFNPITFPGVNEGLYYIVVRHRNHLAIMSAAKQTLSCASVLYDFTTAVAQAYGNVPMLLSGDNKAIMIGGDVNSNLVARANGSVSVNDLTILKNYVGTNTFLEYSAKDVSLDGAVRANGSSTVNDATKLSTFVGTTTYISGAPQP